MRARLWLGLLLVMVGAVLAFMAGMDTGGRVQDGDEGTAAPAINTHRGVAARSAPRGAAAVDLAPPGPAVVTAQQGGRGLAVDALVVLAGATSDPLDSLELTIRCPAGPCGDAWWDVDGIPHATSTLQVRSLGPALLTATPHVPGRPRIDSVRVLAVPRAPELTGGQVLDGREAILAWLVADGAMSRCRVDRQQQRQLCADLPAVFPPPPPGAAYRITPPDGDRGTIPQLIDVNRTGTPTGLVPPRAPDGTGFGPGDCGDGWRLAWMDRGWHIVHGLEDGCASQTDLRAAAAWLDVSAPSGASPSVSGPGRGPATSEQVEALISAATGLPADELGPAGAPPLPRPGAVSRGSLAHLVGWAAGLPASGAVPEPPRLTGFAGTGTQLIWELDNGVSVVSWPQDGALDGLSRCPLTGRIECVVTLPPGTSETVIPVVGPAGPTTVSLHTSADPVPPSGQTTLRSRS